MGVISLGIVGAWTLRADAAADTCTWTGAVDSSFVDGANWTGCDNGGVPEVGDSLVFPESASNKSILIDGAPVLESMTITGTGYIFNSSGDPLVFDTSGTKITADESATFNTFIEFGSGSLTNSTVRVATGKTLALNVLTVDNGIGDVDFGTSTSGYEGNVTIGILGGSAGQVIASHGTTLTIQISNAVTADTVGAETNGVFVCEVQFCFGVGTNDIYMGGGTVRLNYAGSYTQDVVTSTTTADESRLEGNANVELTGSVSINDNLVLVENGNGYTLTLSGPAISIATGSQLLVQGLSPISSTVDIDNDITGTDDLGLLVSNTTLILSGDSSTYDGGTTLDADAVVNVQHEDALGTGLVTVNDGTTVEFQNLPDPAVVPNDFTLEGTGYYSQGALVQFDEILLRLDGDIELTGDTLIGSESPTSSSSSFVLRGIISGTGNLTFASAENPNNFNLGGTDPNTFDGDVTVTSGYLYLSKQGAIPGDLILAPSGETLSTTINIDSGLSDAVGGGLIGTGITSVYEYFVVTDDETVSGLSMDGPGSIFICSAKTLTVDQDSNTTFAGLFQPEITCVDPDPHEIVKKGVGALTLSADDPTDEDTYLVAQQGDLIVNGDRALTPVDIVGGTLKGSGHVGAVSGIAGHLNAGTSPGCLTIESLYTSADFNFDVEINGSVACSAYDRTEVRGAAALNNSALNVTLGATPPLGSTFTILTASSLTGTFAGLPNGAVFSSGGSAFQITYTSTAVLLTAVDPSFVVPAPVSGILAATGSSQSTLLIASILIVATGWILTQRIHRVRYFG